MLMGVHEDDVTLTEVDSVGEVVHSLRRAAHVGDIFSVRPEELREDRLVVMQFVASVVVPGISRKVPLNLDVFVQNHTGGRPERPIVHERQAILDVELGPDLPPKRFVRDRREASSTQGVPMGSGDFCLNGSGEWKSTASPPTAAEIEEPKKRRRETRELRSLILPP